MCHAKIFLYLCTLAVVSGSSTRCCGTFAAKSFRESGVESTNSTSPCRSLVSVEARATRPRSFVLDERISQVLDPSSKSRNQWWSSFKARVGQVVPEGAQAGDFGSPEALGVGGGSDDGPKSEGLDGERASAADGPLLGERDGDGSGESSGGGRGGGVAGAERMADCASPNSGTGSPVPAPTRSRFKRGGAGANEAGWGSSVLVPGAFSP